jgi:hypothetical protein
MLTLVEFVDALHKLSSLQGDIVVRQITVPLVQFAYLCSEAYSGVRQLFQQCVTLAPVFQMLDLVRVHDNFLTSVSCEKKACAAFAAWNNLAVLNYLYDTGFSWDEETLFYAVQFRSSHCLQFALSHDCPLTSISEKEFAEMIMKHGF